MSKINSGGPAFPIAVENNNPFENDIYGVSISADSTCTFAGMSLRDYMAAKAMQSLIGLPLKKWPAGCDSDSISETAYAMADAMILARGGE